MELDPKTWKVTLTRTPSCATPAQLERLRGADRAEPEDVRVAEHVAGCFHCKTELALLQAFEEASPRVEEEEDARWITARLEADLPRTIAAEKSAAAARRGWLASGWRRATGIAAGVAVAAAALALVVDLGGRRRPPPLATDAAQETTLRSGAVTLLAPRGDVAEIPSELRWEPVPQAASYSVLVTEIDRTPVWKVEARQPATLLPREIRDRIVRGAPLQWQVVARDAAGEAVATSTVQRFRVRGRDASRTPP